MTAMRIANPRACERAEMVRRLGDGAVVDLVAWDGHLSDALTGRVVCVEKSDDFCAELRKRHPHVIHAQPWQEIDVVAADAVAVMVGLHHYSDRARIFANAWRMLKPGGKIVVAEVQAGSSVAAFLDSIPGHRGDYPTTLAPELEAAGFVDVSEEVVDCEWRFDSERTARGYTRALFGVEPLPGLTWDWSLLFAEGTCPR